MGIDIGSDSIRIAVMERAKAGPRVLGLYEERVELEPGLTEAQIVQRRIKAIQDVIKREKIKTRNAVFSVPGQTVIIKRLRLPKTDADRLAKMVSYEAKQQIPFPLEKTILEYQVFDDGVSSEYDVLLGAVKREFVDSFMKMITRTRLKALAISVSSLALYNFHELNSGRRDLDEGAQKRKEKEAKKAAAAAAKAKKKKPKKGAAQAEPEVSEEEPLESMGFEEVQACINLGHKILDLAIPRTGDNPMLGFPRSVPLGGENIDRKIAEELGLNDEAEARRIKETQTAVLGMEFELEGDRQGVNMAASKAATAVVDRMVSEIRRSLDFYISQPDGVAVDSVVLSGGLAAMKYLPAYLEEKLGMPVNLTEPKNSQIRMPDRVPKDFYTYAIALGLAAQGTGYGQTTISFLPEDLKAARSLVERPSNLLGMGALMGLVVLMSPWVANQPIAQMRAAVANSQEMIQRAKVDQMEIQEQDGMHAKINEAFTKLSQAAGDRDFWFRFMQVVYDSRPGDVLIDDITMRLDGNVVIIGKASKPSSVTQFINELKTHGEFVYEATGDDIRPEFDRRFGGVEVTRYMILVKAPVRQGRSRTVGINPMTQQDFAREQSRENAQRRSRSVINQRRP